ncbi:MAG TPA: metallophosphoesterase [Solirubrobacter sp.]|nr:metallophosphoesterase [Solirubrobacter sp.]
MRTLVVSDLHLGKTQRTDLLRRADLRAPLLEALDDVDRFVILGDGLELREAAHRDALEIAAPFFADVGAALGPDKELLLLAGNHDHGLAAGWIDARLQSEPSGFLGLEQRFEPRDAGPLAQRLAAAAAPARLQLAYPGVWLREDVYAFHGHYADVHATVPTFERLAAGTMARYVAKLPARHATADDYEAVLSPLYAWLHALTQRADHSVVSVGGSASASTYGRLTGPRTPRSLALQAGYRATVFALNRAGLGPLEANLSATALRRGYLRGIREVIARLDLPARHVVWGHSHRSGPWPGDDPVEWDGIVNTGSWVYQPHFVGPEPNRSPYWPGTAVIVEDDGPPRLVRLLGDRGHAELRPDRA